jgi:hypothetical protein
MPAPPAPGTAPPLAPELSSLIPHSSLPQLLRFRRSGENLVFEAERALLRSRGQAVGTFTEHSESITFIKVK